jgi:hypothetical protein
MLMAACFIAKDQTYRDFGIVIGQETTCQMAGKGAAKFGEVLHQHHPAKLSELGVGMEHLVEPLKIGMKSPAGRDGLNILSGRTAAKEGGCLKDHAVGRIEIGGHLIAFISEREGPQIAFQQNEIAAHLPLLHQVFALFEDQRLKRGRDPVDCFLLRSDMRDIVFYKLYKRLIVHVREDQPKLIQKN